MWQRPVTGHGAYEGLSGGGSQPHDIDTITRSMELLDKRSRESSTSVLILK